MNKKLLQPMDKFLQRILSKFPVAEVIVEKNSRIYYTMTNKNTVAKAFLLHFIARLCI